MLTQTFPVVLAAAVLWVGCALLSRRAAVLAGLIVGLGLAWLWLTVAAGWQGQTWVRVVLPLALLVAGAAITRIALRSRHETDGRTPTFRHWKAIAAVAVAVAVAVAASLVVAGFGLPIRPGEYALQAEPVPLWQGYACAGVGLVSTVVRGSPNDPHVAWLEQSIAAPGLAVVTQRIEAIWPQGYRARFTPKLEVLDGWGNVVLRDGDTVSGTCGPSDGGYFLVPPFN